MQRIFGYRERSWPNYDQKGEKAKSARARRSPRQSPGTGNKKGELRTVHLSELVVGSGGESNPNSSLLAAWDRNSKGLAEHLDYAELDQLFDTLAAWNDWLEKDNLLPEDFQP